MRVSVVKDPKQIFSRSIDGLSQEEVGEEKLVAAIVELVVTVGSGQFVSLHCGHIQLYPA